MFTSLTRKMSRLKKTIKNFFADPPLDILGVGVLSSLMGRGFLLVSFSAAFYSAAMFWQAGVIMAVLAMDTVVHLEVLSGLRRLMGYEVLAEVAAIERSR